MVLDTIAIEIQRTWKAHRRYHESLIKNRKLRLAKDDIVTALATDFVTLPIGEWIALPYPLAFESFHFAMSFPRLLSHNLK